MTRETKSKVKTNLFEWVLKPLTAPILLAVIFGAWAFFSDSKSSTNVNASEVVNIKRTQDKMSQEMFTINNCLESKTDELKNAREHSEIKTAVDKKADKEDIEDLKKSIQKIDDRTYQILMLLKER